MASTSSAQVSIVHVPRERFSYAIESLESIRDHTEVPYRLVVVDGRSPRRVSDGMRRIVHEVDGRMIRVDRWLPPNQARNIGATYAETEYVVFCDNDVIVTAGWLDALVRCADETGAAAVVPLTCQGIPLHQEIHCAGGRSGIRVEMKEGRAERHLIDKIAHQNRRVSEMRNSFERKETSLVEFHCVLVRRSMLDQIGGLDERLLSTKEHVDFSMTIIDAGGTIFFEPDSLVTYKYGTYPRLSDIPFYMLRWSDAWERSSLHHLRDKWSLTEDRYFKNRYNKLGWRRRKTLIRPLVDGVPFLRNHRKARRKAEDAVASAERVLNRLVTENYARSQERPMRVEVVESSPDFRPAPS